MDGTAHTEVPFDVDTAPTWTSEMDVAIRTVRFRFDFKTGHSITGAISRGLWRRDEALKSLVDGITDDDGPDWVMKAMNRGHIREFNPAAKQHHWGRKDPHRGAWPLRSSDTKDCIF